MIKIGVFGAGRGIDVAKNFMLQDCEIVALCEINEKRAEDGLKNLGMEVPVFKDFDEFLKIGMDANTVDMLLSNKDNEKEFIYSYAKIGSISKIKGNLSNPKTDDIVNRYLLAGVGGILVLMLVSRIRRR